MDLNVVLDFFYLLHDHLYLLDNGLYLLLFALDPWWDKLVRLSDGNSKLGQSLRFCRGALKKSMLGRVGGLNSDFVTWVGKNRCWSMSKIAASIFSWWLEKIDPGVNVIGT